jgi:4-cresol dehydrogenase (hydroxylating) flavoprotein subunit
VLLDRAADTLGGDAVTRAADALRELTLCTTGDRFRIAGAVHPASVKEVQHMAHLARELGVPLYPVSRGHNWGYGTANPVTDGCVLVCLSRMQGIDIDADVGLATVEPGVTQGILASYLDWHGLPFLVPTTGAGPQASLVGNALERGYGITPVADHFGAVMGLEAVLPDGSIYRSPLAAMGGLRRGGAYRWGIGPYLDGLFAQGAFGIVTRMTIALARRPEAMKCILFDLPDDGGLERAVTAVRSVITELPGIVGGINLMNARRVLAMSTPYPHDRVGPNGVIPNDVLRNHARRLGIRPWTGFGMLYGTSRVARAATRDVRRILSPVVSSLRLMSPKTVRHLGRIAYGIPVLGERLRPRLSMLESAMELVGGRPNETALSLAYWRSGKHPMPGIHLDPARDGCGLIWYAPLVEMTPDRVRGFVEFISHTMPRHGCEPLITLSSLSERCFGSSIPILFDKDSGEKAAQECYLELLEEGRNAGFFPYRVSTEAMDWLMRQAPEHWNLVASLKGALDPEHLIAPGRYAPLRSRSSR